MRLIVRHLTDLYVVRYYQFDSWWYYKGANKGVSLWEPRRDVFPNGMEYVAKALG